MHGTIGEREPMSTPDPTTPTLPPVPTDWVYGSPQDAIADKYAMELVRMPGLVYLLNRYSFAMIKTFFINAVADAAKLETPAVPGE